MCSSVSDWFTGGGRLTADKVADRYIEMVMRLVRGSARRASIEGRQCAQAATGRQAAGADTGLLARRR